MGISRDEPAPVTRTELCRFIGRHRLGVLATVSASGAPEAAVVGVAVTDDLELIFDTVESTRKAQNLRRDPRIAFVIGWDDEQTVQYEGTADEPAGDELERLRRWNGGPRRRQACPSEWPDSKCEGPPTPSRTCSRPRTGGPLIARAWP